MSKCKKCNGNGYVYVKEEEVNHPRTLLPSFTTRFERKECECKVQKQKGAK